MLHIGFCVVLFFLGGWNVTQLFWDYNRYKSESEGAVEKNRPFVMILTDQPVYTITVHPGRLTWNIQITHLERKMIFRTPVIMFHVNLPGCRMECHFVSMRYLFKSSVIKALEDILMCWGVEHRNPFCHVFFLGGGEVVHYNMSVFPNHLFFLEVHLMI